MEKSAEMRLFEMALSMLADKNGRLLQPVIDDMRGRDNPVVIINMACDGPDAGINTFIAANRIDETAAGIAALAETCKCSEIIIYSGGAEAVGAAKTAAKTEAIPAKEPGAEETATEKIAAAVKQQTSVPVKAMTGPESPVLRDETALFSAMDTGISRVNRAEQEYYSSFLSYGYQGRPTLVVDGEAAYQAGRLYMDPAAKKTKLVSLGCGAQIIEVQCGTSIAELLDDNTTGATAQIVQIGGINGSFKDVETLKDTRIEFSYEYDSVWVPGSGDCVINRLAGIYETIKELSCTKCVLCREGSRQLSAIFSDMTEGRSNRDDIALIEDICPIINVGALCEFGKNMVIPALTAVVVCRDAFENHIIKKSCPAGLCKGLLNYVIDPALCTGCGDCIDVCPEDAIDGKDGFIHIIDGKLCEKCGKCADACGDGAIKLDSGSIKTPRKPVRVGSFQRGD